MHGNVRAKKSFEFSLNVNAVFPSDRKPTRQLQIWNYIYACPRWRRGAKREKKKGKEKKESEHPIRVCIVKRSDLHAFVAAHPPLGREKQYPRKRIHVSRVHTRINVARKMTKREIRETVQGINAVESSPTTRLRRLDD